MASPLGAAGIRTGILNSPMARGLVAIGTVLLVLALLGLGYLAQANIALPSVSDPSWGHDPPTVAIGVQGPPLIYMMEGESVGLLVDLFDQVPLGNRSWLLSTVSERDAVAAVNAGAADVAVLAVLRGQSASGLGSSEPLLSHPVSLFAPGPLLPPDNLEGQRIAWSGPEGMTQSLLRMGAEPVGTASVADCLTRVISGSAAACAVDEAVGTANVRQLGLGDSLVIVGDPVAMVDYVLAWHPSDRVAPSVLGRWVNQVRASGILPSLQRRWLGRSPLAADETGPTDTTVALFVGLAATSGVALILAASNRTLRQRAALGTAATLPSPQAYAALAEETDDAVFLLDTKQLQILEANPQAHRLTGYGPGELVGMRFHQLVPSRHRRLLRQAFLEDQEVEPLPDLPLIHRDGSVATVSMHSHIAETEAGPVRVCVVRDVTEQRFMAREVRRLSDFAQRILDSIPNPVLTVDGVGYVTSANRALLSILGVDEAPVGQHVDHIFPNHQDRLGPLVSAVAAGELAQPEQVSVSRPDGREEIYHVTATPMQDNERVSGVILVLSQERQDHGSSAEYQRLATLSTLGQMSGVLAHDIRNRVTGVHVGVQYLAEKFPQDDPRRRSMEYIRSETEQVMEVIDDILTLIRPGKMEKHACCIPDILDRVMRAHAPLSQGNCVEVTATVPASLPRVSGDPVQLERALSNLVKNAIEAVPEGGRVRISAEPVTLQTNGRGSPAVRILISDNGPGIPPNIRARLFQPFVSEKLQGTGLGLSVAKRVIDDHGGSIEVDTSPSCGTTFTVVLPAAAERG